MGIKKTDIEALEKQAWTSDTEAMYGVASAYRDGLGVEKNEEKASEWLERRFLILEYRAEADDAYAIDRLADAYRLGIGVEQDLEKAKYWRARFKPVLAGQTAEIRREEAAKEKEEAEKRIFLLKKRAEDGDIEAMLDLAVGYRYGRGVEIDLEKSRHWLEEWDLTVKKAKQEHYD